MGFVLTLLGMRSLSASKVGTVFLMLVCLFLLALPLMLNQAYLSSITIISAISLLLLIKRFFNLK